MLLGCGLHLVDVLAVVEHIVIGAHHRRVDAGSAVHHVGRIRRSRFLGGSIDEVVVLPTPP